MARKTKEIWKIYKNVFDSFTIATILKLISRGVFEGLESPVKIGKESNVFSALAKGRKKVIVKIYRLESCNFNKIYDYLKADPRYQSIKKQKRQLIFYWVQREYRNMLKAAETGISSPMPFAFLNNVLVMQMIGDPAPQLKDAFPEDPENFFSMLLACLKRLYSKTRLVHSDLSAFNILNYNEKPFLIDFSQATPADSPEARAFLKRDLGNIEQFCKKNSFSFSAEKALKEILES